MYESDAGEQHQMQMLNKASRFSPSPFSLLPPLFWCNYYFVCLDIVTFWFGLSGSRQATAFTRSHRLLCLKEAAIQWLKWQQ